MNEKSRIYKYDVRVNSARGVNRLLQRVINALIRDEMKQSKAKTIGYLCNIILKGLEIGDLEDRLAALEDRLAARGKKVG